MLAITLIRGWTPIPFEGRSYPNGPHPGFYHATIVMCIGFIIFGIVAHLLGK